jgi:hypothetical protein
MATAAAVQLHCKAVMVAASLPLEALVFQVCVQGRTCTLAHLQALPCSYMSSCFVLLQIEAQTLRSKLHLQPCGARRVPVDVSPR